MKNLFKNYIIPIMIVFVAIGLSSCFKKEITDQYSEKNLSVYTAKLGDFEIIALQDASIEIEAKLFKTGDQKIIEKYMPNGKIKASINTYLVKTKSEKILIDAGSGDSQLFSGSMLKELEKINIKPEDITIVLITHAHFDHVAGLVSNDKAVFPNVKIQFSKKEMETFTDQALTHLPSDVKPYYKTANKILKIYKNRIKPFNAGEVIIEGITSVDLSGHTPGQVGYMIKSDGETLFVVGDLLHVAEVQFPHPEYSLIYDADVTKAIERRKNVLRRASNEKLLIAGMHIPFPGIGYVTKDGNGFSFIPIKK